MFTLVGEELVIGFGDLGIGGSHCTDWSLTRVNGSNEQFSGKSSVMPWHLAW